MQRKSLVFCLLITFLAVLVFPMSIYSEGAKKSEKKGYPTKSINLVVPYGPGGATDLAARSLVSVIPEFLGESVVVVNKPGAGGAVGFDFVRKSEPDIS